MNKIKPVYQAKRFDETGWADVTQESHKNCELAQTVLETRILYPAAAYEAQTQRANALALVINDLTKIVTHDAETKEQFIERAKAIMSVDPDLRVSELQSAYDGIQAEHLRVSQTLYDEIKIRDQRISELQTENKSLKEKTGMFMGVGDGAGSLYVYGDYESIKAAQTIVFKSETKTKRIAELEKENERLMTIIDSRPAINAGLPQSYIDWSQSIYGMQFIQFTQTEH